MKKLLIVAVAALTLAACESKDPYGGGSDIPREQCGQEICPPEKGQ